MIYEVTRTFDTGSKTYPLGQHILEEEFATLGVYIDFIRCHTETQADVDLLDSGYINKLKAIKVSPSADVVIKKPTDTKKSK